MNDQNKKQIVVCTECDNEFEYDITGLEEGDIIECPICGANLEILSLDPFKVDSIVDGK